MKYSIWILFLLIASCKTDHIREAETLPHTSGGEIMADTIIYDVIIKNNNPEDSWAEESLRKLQHTKLIDSVFNLVYQEKVTAYEYFTNEVMSIAEIKKLEQENVSLRQTIGKIQFTERWYLDGTVPALHKEVLSIVLGNEVYADSSEFRGYKPVFKIVLKP